MTPKSNANIRIWWDAGVGAYRMTSPYNADLVDGLKSVIPGSDRSYDSTTKVWTFVERQLGPLQILFTTLGIQPVVITRAQVEQQQTASQHAGAGAGASNGAASRIPLNDVIIEFVKLLPYEAAKAAYRKASLELHPDKNNGDASRMTQLNVSWDRITKEVYKQ